MDDPSFTSIREEKTIIWNQQPQTPLEFQKNHYEMSPTASHAEVKRVWNNPAAPGNWGVV